MTTPFVHEYSPMFYFNAYCRGNLSATYLQITGSIDRVHRGLRPSPQDRSEEVKKYATIKL